MSSVNFRTTRVISLAGATLVAACSQPGRSASYAAMTPPPPAFPGPSYSAPSAPAPLAKQAPPTPDPPNLRSEEGPRAKKDDVSERGGASPSPVLDDATLKELARRIHVENPEGYFSSSALQTFFARHLPQETLQHLANSSDAIWVDSSHAALKNGRLYCFASIGLTTKAPDKRNPRIPTSRYSGSQLFKEGDDQSNEGIRSCRVAALESAVGAMGQDALSGQLYDIAWTREKGKQAVGLKPEPTTATVFSSGLSDVVRQRAFEAIPSDFRQAFDYRKLEWVVLAWVYRLAGHTVCRAEVGVAAHSPEGRTPHWPGYTWSTTWEMTQEQSRQRNAEDTCKGDVIASAIESALKESWDKAGLLNGFDRTDEDGVAPVAPVKRPTSPARGAPTPVEAPSPAQGASDRLGKCQPPSGKVLRYSDRCSNGDCTRTFENGCSVRFQAPYCYDALSGRWTWKPDGC